MHCKPVLVSLSLCPLSPSNTRRIGRLSQPGGMTVGMTVGMRVGLYKQIQISSEGKVQGKEGRSKERKKRSKGRKGRSKGRKGDVQGSLGRCNGRSKGGKER